MSKYQQSLIDDLDEALSFARGIEAAMRGLECLDEDMQEGVVELQLRHIERLEAIGKRATREISERQRRRPALIEAA